MATSNTSILEKYLSRSGDGGIIHTIVNKYCINDIGDITVNNDCDVIIGKAGMVLEDLKQGRINIGFANVYTGINSKYNHHCNTLIFEYIPYLGWTCTRFEPRGYGTDLYNFKKVDGQLKHFFESKMIKYVSPSEYQSKNGPQTIEGLCTAHSLQFISEYAKNINQDKTDINNSLFSKDIVQFIKMNLEQSLV